MTLFEKKIKWIFVLSFYDKSKCACMHDVKYEVFLIKLSSQENRQYLHVEQEDCGTQRCLLLLVRRQESFRLSYMQQPSLQHTKGISIKLLQIRVQCTLKLFYAHEVKSILTDVISPSILSTIDSLFTRGIHIRSMCSK